MLYSIVAIFSLITTNSSVGPTFVSKGGGGMRFYKKRITKAAVPRYIYYLISVLPFSPTPLTFYLLSTPPSYEFRTGQMPDMCIVTRPIFT